MNKTLIANISIVIPAYDADLYIINLIEKIELQTLRPKEIIIIDSSLTNKIKSLIDSRKNLINIVVKNIEFSYPGRARNIGVAAANYDWIAFLDCRTIPNKNWLESLFNIAIAKNTHFIGAIRLCSADTEFKKILRAATYGRIPVKSLAGSIIKKDLFNQVGGFNPKVRAGEDLEWFDKFKIEGIYLEWVNIPYITYEGLPDSLIKTIQKWYIYNISNSQIIIKTNQKIAYLIIFLLFILLISWNWNYLVADWDESNIFYIPNITKIFLSLLIFIYFLMRGIVFPMLVKESLEFLFPIRFLKICYVAICIDIAKAPGMIVGGLKIIFKSLKIKL